MASLSTHSLRPSNSSQSVRNVSGSQSGRPGAPPLTVENALAQANGNTSVALENVVNERNMLSNQNTQLWRLIEKQRSVGKELERVRAERDRAVAKLESRNVGEGGSTSSLSSSTTTRIRASPSAPSATTMATSADDSDAATTPSKPRTIRHNSSDVRAPSTDSSKGSSTRPGPQRHQSDPHHEPARLQQQNSAPIDVPQLQLTSPPTIPTTVVLEPSPVITVPPNGLNPMSSNSSAANKRSNRESRISLPDEASRYIASMVDSPIPSPRGPGQSSSQQQSSLSVEDNTLAYQSNPGMGAAESRARSPEAEPQPLQQQAARVPSPAEEMYAESIISISSRRSASRGVDESPFEDVSDAALDDSPPSGALHTDDESIRGNSETFSPPAGQPSTLQPGLEPDSASISTASSAAVARERDLSPTVEAAFRQPALTSQASFPPPTQSGTTKPAQFKSTRLSVDDFPYTKIKIHGSNIKTNDRGKEVLSFLFMIYPSGDGEPPVNANPLKRNVPPAPQKDSWVIEKLYSEILALDTNLRGKLGKNGGKKLAPLPDGKLFKDHAPAKADARKAILEAYMQTLVTIPLKDKNEICMFLSTDVVRGTAVMNADHKEGYLTKRGKNFGGWKTRYFVLQSPVLEYYESRGGQHLGSIAITGAQIGRQQKTTSSRESDDENSYRHAFLIIENKKGPGGSSVRHVLCAETDEERDAWVELLVKYVVAGQQKGGMGGLAYEDEHRNSTSTAISDAGPSAGRASIDPLRWGGARRDESAPKPSLDSFSESASVHSTLASSAPPTDGQTARRILERNGGQSPEVPFTSSSSPNSLDQMPPRANSELGHYSDVTPPPPPPAAPANGTPIPAPRATRASFHPAHAAIKAAVSHRDGDRERATSPEKELTPKVKISGPINGAPIPAGAKFGNDPPVDKDRERKAKSGRFWGFGRAGGAGPSAGLVPRAVFGVPLEVSLSVSQIAELPAVVFRCIEYLEAKNAEQEEGIYRLSGSSNVIKNLKERFNMEGDVDLLKADEYWDPHAIAGLLKTFLRDLPTSILTRELHLRFLGVIDLANQEERIQELATLISMLPSANYGLLRALTAHLILIVQNSNINKMTMRNVGIVFSPTLGIPAGVFGLMLGEFEQVFNVNGIAGDSSKSDEGTVMPEGTISNRNSRSYADAAADKLLGLSGRKLRSTDEESDDTDDEIAESSGTETENDTQDTSPPNTPGPNTYNGPPVDPNATPSRSVPHSASVAAQRGLQVNVPPASNGRRASGLPASPRPRPTNPPINATMNPSPAGSPMTATINPGGRI